MLVRVARAGVHALCRRLWGEVVVWGTTNKAKSVEECCDMCKKFQPKSEDDFTCNGGLAGLS